MILAAPHAVSVSIAVGAPIRRTVLSKSRHGQLVSHDGFGMPSNQRVQPLTVVTVNASTASISIKASRTFWLTFRKVAALRQPRGTPRTGESTSPAIETQARLKSRSDRDMLLP